MRTQKTYMGTPSVVHTARVGDVPPIPVEDPNVHEIRGVHNDRLPFSSGDSVCLFHAMRIPVGPVELVVEDVQTKGMLETVGWKGRKRRLI